MSAEQLTLEVLSPSLGRAVEWRRQNPVAYAQIVEWAREDEAHGVRPAIDLYVNLLRRPHFSQKLGLVRTDAGYAFNNNLRSELARLIRREHPELRFELRHASFDEPGVANASVGP